METKIRQYSGQFKKDAVEYILTSGKVVEEVARDLGISPHNLKRWHTVPQTWRTSLPWSW